MNANSFFHLEIQDLCKPTSVFKLLVRWFTSIGEIKEKLHKLINYPSSRMQIFFPSNPYALSNKVTLSDLGIYNEGKNILLLSLKFANSQYIIQPLKGCAIDAASKEMLSEVRQGINNNMIPSKTDLLDCTGGVYFMKATNGTFCAVFKPQDEEQGMIFNPKGYAGNGKTSLRSNFKPGAGYIREAAAYKFDYKNFCSVPPTMIIHCEHPVFNYGPHPKTVFPKLGSLQKYIRAYDTYENISSSLISPFEIQKIALLDIRILNCDRNASNILVLRKNIPSGRRYSRSGSLASSLDGTDDLEMDINDFMNGESPHSGNDQYELIPIDHGYCLPNKLLIEDFDWEWYNTPHIEREVEPEIKHYINEIDIEKLLSSITSEITLSFDCLFLLRLVHYLLQEGVIKHNFTLKNIADYIVRTETDVPSILEKVIETSEENAFRVFEIRSESQNSRAKAFPSNSSSNASSPSRSKGRSPNLVSNIVNKIYEPTPLRINPVDMSDNIRSVSSTLTLKPPFEMNYSPNISYDIPVSPVGYYLNESIDSDSIQAPVVSNQLFGGPVVSMHSFDAFGGVKSPHFPSLLKMKSLQSATDRNVNINFLNSLTGPKYQQDNYDSASQASSYTTNELTSSDTTLDKCDPLKSASLSTSDEDIDNANIDAEEKDLFNTDHLSLTNMTRIVSFGAFESPAWYESNSTNDRYFNKLRREKRKNIKKTKEFQNLRLELAIEALNKILLKNARSRTPLN